MNISRSLRIILICIVISILAFTCVGMTYAATSSELKSQQSDIDAKIKEKKNEMTAIKAEKSEALSQISNLNAQISTYEGEISNLNTKIDGLEQQIDIKQNELNEKQSEYDVQKDQLEKRLVAMYESGSMSYIDMLLSADSLSDFISKYYLISQIAEYDQELLQRIVDSKNQIQAEKDYIESAKDELETSKSSMVSKKTSLASSKKQKDALVSNLSEEEKQVQAEIDEFERDKAAIAAELAAIARKSGIKDVVAPSAAGYISPLAGKTKGNITTGYGAYRGHTGADFACAGGTPIRAVKSGTVITSMAKVNSSGRYYSYGEYIVIDHHDGTMTLYAHMSPGSRCVSPGQIVAQGQQIGSVGTTGNSTGNHLHFEVRVGGYPVNPTPYLP